MITIGLDEVLFRVMSLCSRCHIMFIHVLTFHFDLMKVITEMCPVH